MAAIGEQNNMIVLRDLRDKFTSLSSANHAPAILPMALAASTSAAVIPHATSTSMQELADIVRRCMKNDVQATEFRLQRLVDLVQLALWIDQ
jgi:hypothetical protein